MTPRRPLSPANWLTIAILLAAVAGFVFAASWASRASTHELRETAEKHWKDSSLHRLLVPQSVRAFIHPQRDNVQHFVVYIPLGLALGGAAIFAGRHWTRRRGGQLLAASAIAAMAWTAFEEFNQRNIPTRTPEWSDLFSTWGGIWVGIGLVFGVRGIRQWRRVRREGPNRTGPNTPAAIENPVVDASSEP